ncbi:MAG: tRNA uridine-5-carboxymethylaminomethyl(34) synthesis GTPase MnmE [Clostridiales bacterium]|nr:tRNA uridine-5-carboxymethylaminomethyl(34) synthesis GTPase MnmE [Clostridiales bacterium]
MRQEINDTIAAIATAVGPGAIGIVRLSGPDAISIIKKVFSPLGKDTWQPHYLVPGWIKDEQGLPLDQAMAVYQPVPRSYSGEDMAELQCHGGPAVLNAVLTLVLHQGARMARPGEFTLRAFLHGRLDLAQAEAVIDLITAPTAAAVTMAARQLKGSLSGSLAPLSERLLVLIASIEAAIDFPDEVEEPAQNRIEKEITEILAEIEEMLRGFSSSRIYRDGLDLVLLGRVNVGKSSLLNAMISEDRIIVSSLPGTTRDLIEVGYDLDGLPLRLTDTAGLRLTGDEIEREGMLRTEMAANQAGLILLVLEAGHELTKEEMIWIEERGEAPIIAVINKTDLYDSGTLREELEQQNPGLKTVSVSALTGAGLNELKAAIKELALGDGRDHRHSGTINNLRQLEALKRTKNSLLTAREGLNLPQDLLVIDLRLAWQSLGEICGQTADEAILDKIFTNFCIGK